MKTKLLIVLALFLISTIPAYAAPASRVQIWCILGIIGPCVPPTPTPTPMPTPTSTPTPTPTPTVAAVTKTMIVNSGSGGGDVTAGGSIVPTDPFKASQRGWRIENYPGSVDFPDYDELAETYTIAEVVASYAAINNSKVYQWNCIAPGPCVIDSSPCGRNIKAVVFVNGDLTISANFASALNNPTIAQLLTARQACNSSIAFIVKGDLTISPTVNNIYGIFYAGGDIITEASATPPDGRLYVFGSLLANGFSLGRNLDADNANYPAEQVIFMPKYFLDLGSSDLLGQQKVTWREK